MVKEPIKGENCMKVLVTGGAGFVGTNLIKLLINKTKYNIISLDNYSSGSLKNHIKSKRVIIVNYYNFHLISFSSNEASTVFIAANFLSVVEDMRRI